MKPIKISLEYINPIKKELIKCSVDSIYSDLYCFDENNMEFNEDDINFHWLNYLANKKIDIKECYLHSYSIDI